METLCSRRTFAALGCASAMAALAGCSGQDSGTSTGSSTVTTDTGSSAPEESVELQIFAANSLEKAMPEVEKLYTDATGVTFADTQYKGSGDLVEQMRGGAPADILITASSSTMDDAAESDLIDSDTREDMFTNELVIVRAEGSDITIPSLEDVVNVDGRIAIGEPGAVPAGKYANQALNSVGLYTGTEGDDGEYDAAIADKVTLADKVGTAAQYVASGDCAIGFVYSSDVYRYDGIEVAFTCPDESHKPIIYPGAVSSTSENAETAADFLSFCMENEDALAVWAEYGFELA